MLPLSLASTTPSSAHDVAPRAIRADLAAGPVDRRHDLSVGPGFPGTLIHPDSHALLATAGDELGFRYVRLHDILRDVLGAVRREGGTIVHDRTRIDHLHDTLPASSFPLTSTASTAASRRAGQAGQQAVALARCDRRRRAAR